MKTTLAGFAAGLLFGVGLALSGMTDPRKVVGFLDVAGAWDPTLLFVIGPAVVVTAIGYRLVFGRGRPALADSFALPTRRDLDARLVGGAALFGLGWGLAGYCPGPALASLGSGRGAVALFVAAMLAGMAAVRLGASGSGAARPAGAA